ncbi:MAG: D-2-hydroxyacid dehydrogenase [Isosphaeraceae bacterium]
MIRREFRSKTAAGLAAAAIANGSWASGRKGPTILIPSTPAEQLADLKSAAPEAEFVVCPNNAAALAAAPNADASYGFISRDLIRAGKALKWVQQPSAGVETIVDIPELRDSGIVLTNMQRVFGPPIADQALAYMLAFTRGLNDFVVRKEWARPKEAVFEELAGKTIVIVGLGGIGSEIARRCHAFGMKVLGTDPKVLDAPPGVLEIHRPGSLASLLPRADVLASAVPLTPETRKLIGGAELALLRPGALLINVSRGGVVDTEALVSALRSKQVAAAGLDVTDPEPLPKDHPLWSLNTIITPHTAGQSPGSDRRRHEVFRENVRRFADGLMLLNVVDKKAGY